MAGGMAQETPKSCGLSIPVVTGANQTQSPCLIIGHLSKTLFLSQNEWLIEPPSLEAHFYVYMMDDTMGG